MAGHYPYLLDPSIYPDHERWQIDVPTWETFDSTTQFTTLRGLTQTEWREDLHWYTEVFKLGKVVWPMMHILWSPHVKEAIEEIKARGLYLFDLWSHVPGCPMEGLWSNITPPPGMVPYLKSVLGDRFLGIDNGEQDGRYVWSNGEQQCPSSPDRRAQYKNFQQHFQRLTNELGNCMTALVSLCFGHYFLKEGNHMLLGAETAQALPCSQIYYAFIRGAGRQYGVPWFGNASMFNRWGWKDYGPEQTEGRQRSGPENGTSLNLLKRLIYTHYLYNCVAVGFELNWLSKKEEYRGPVIDEGPEDCPYTLTPIGAIQADAVSFVAEYGQPGTMHAPVAIMLDFFAGWAPPRHLYTQNIYQVWGALPYEAGDYLTHGVLSTLYPGYEDASYYHDERGFLTPTPFGDMADCVLSDVPEWVLDQYSVTVIADKLEVDAETTAKLLRYVDNGGHLVVTGVNARQLLPELGIFDDPIPALPGRIVRWSDEQDTDTEIHDFTLLKIGNLPDDACVTASCGDIPAVIELTRGAGRISIAMSPFGLNAIGLDHDHKIENAEDTPLSCPFTLLRHVRRLLESAFAGQRLFSVGEGMGYVTCRKAPGSYTLGIHNNTLDALPFAIKSHLGTIKKVTELSLGQREKGALGYWPKEFRDNAGGENDENTIAGGDVRLFSIEVDEAGIDCKPPASPPVARGNWFAPLPRGTRIQSAIQRAPTFFQHFQGVKVGWHDLLESDPRQLERERDWLERNGVRIVVDFRNGLNFYPELTLLDTYEPHFRRSVEQIDDVMNKMTLIGASDAIITLHRKPDTHWDIERTQREFVTRLRELCERAQNRGVKIHLVPHAKRWVETTAKAVEIAKAVDASNLLVAIDTGHTAIVGESLSESVLAAGDRLGAILFSGALKDRYGQWYDTHASFSSLDQDGFMPMEIVAANKVLYIVDGEYAELNDVYPDLIAAGRSFENQR